MRLVLMITDCHGTYSLNLHIFFKRIFLYALVFLTTLIAFIVTSLGVFNYELKKIAINNEILEQEYAKLLGTNKKLSQTIAQRIEEITLVGDRVEYLEGMVGVPSDTKEYEGMDYGLKDRIDNASIAGAQKAWVMKFIPNGYPLDYYYRISDVFGYRIHPILNKEHLHVGIDFSAEIGTPIYATADGVVEFAHKGFNGGYGHMVKIDHSFGFKTYYAHLEDLLVKRGDFVKKGQMIAHSGNSGKSTGPHLHYEIRFLGAYINPDSFLKWNMQGFSLIFEKEKNIPWQSLLTTITTMMEQVEQPLSQVEQK